MAKILIVATW